MITKHNKAIVILQALYNNESQERIIANLKTNIGMKRKYNNLVKLPMTELNDSYDLAIKVINQRIHNQVSKP